LPLGRADGKEFAATGRGPLLVDRVIDDLLRDDLRVSKDAWQREKDDEFERLLTGRSEQRYESTSTTSSRTCRTPTACSPGGCVEIWRAWRR
jgi:hypothetical protein